MTILKSLLIAVSFSSISLIGLAKSPTATIPISEKKLTPPENNTKECQTLDNLNQYLRQRGWHRHEAEPFTDQLSHLFDGKLDPSFFHPDENKPLPAPHLFNLFSGLIQTYQLNYTQFEKETPEVAQHSPIDSPASSQPGKWHHILMAPTAGRIYDLELNPKNPKEMYANPDGDGIYFTKNSGRHWINITDSIPLRQHRDCYENIIVDPKKFSHVFSISRMGHLYEYTHNLVQGGQWKERINVNHKAGNAPNFKWVEALRDKNDKLIIIGVVTKSHGMNGGWKTGVYRTEDRGHTWQKIPVPGKKFQEMAFHRSKKNIIYLANQSQIYISNDAGKSFHLLHDFKTGNRPMFISPLYGKDADALYVAVSIGNDTQVYFSPDRGESWELRQDSKKGIGSKFGVFGKSGSSNWTSFFEVDPFDKNHLVCSNVGSCESFDGGVTWEYFSWGKRANAVMPDGSIALSPHGGHNADNHILKFHPKQPNLQVKGCDAGIMMKSEKKAKNWTNINGDMPAFLWFSIIVNEFGDRYISGNTQDVNVQTYRYRSWENERGYEGDSIFINPYTNTTYYPTAATEKGEGLNFLEPGFWKMHSWSMPKSYVNYQNPNELYVAFGRRPTEKSRQLPKFLYVTKNRGISYERVPHLDKEVFIANISRTTPAQFTAFTAKAVMISHDMGETWEKRPYSPIIKSSGGTRKISAAVNPTNPQQLWVGGRDGKVVTSNDGGKSWSDISEGLPSGQVLELHFHEGTAGDLYALISGYGVFFRDAKTKKWTYWMNGYNLTDFREIRIDYPSQKLVAASYGRGAWEAPLEHPCERFYKNGFPIKQVNSLRDISVFKIDAPWVTPDYYRYQWLINGKPLKLNRPILATNLCKKGDKVQLILSPRYSPKIHTHSKTITVTNVKSPIDTTITKPTAIESGYIDLGIVETFAAHQDTTFELVVQLNGPGVIAGNRRHFYRDAKGWILSVDKKGKLSLLLSPKQNGNYSRTFGKPKEQGTLIASSAKAVPFSKWVSIAFTISKEGKVQLYVGGHPVAQGDIGDLYKKHSLNSVLNTSLFADPIGMKATKGKIQHVGIWDRVLSPEELQNGKLGSSLKSIKNQIFFINFEWGKTPQEIYSGRKVIFRPASTKQTK